MKQLSFISKTIEKHYAHFDEDRKRNVTIGIILNLMMIIVMGGWIIGFWLLEMMEIFWVVLILWAGYVLLLVGLLKYGMRYETWRFSALGIAGAITAIPSLFYGFDSVVTLHMVLVPIVLILLFSRKERKNYFHSC